MMMFATGVIVTLLVLFVVSTVTSKYAIKRGWYASAIWSEKDQQWKVRGHYLSIAQRIHNGIKYEAVTGEKKVKYMK